ncbi:discoidin domain-containing protein, partial [Nocardioides hankookensis]
SDPTTPAATGKPSTSASAGPITGVRATDFDPEGDPPEEYPELAPLAVDGDPATSWHTMDYKQNFGPGGLKSGVGLLLDLDSVQDVSSVDVTVGGGATGVSLYLADTAPTSVDGLTPAATATVTGTQPITLDQPVQGRYLVVWLTSVPTVGSDFRGEVAEVTVRG